MPEPIHPHAAPCPQQGKTGKEQIRANRSAALLITLLATTSGALTPGGFKLDATLNPGRQAVLLACRQGEADSRTKLDRSAQGIVTIKGGETPVGWQGGLTNAYRFCKQQALDLQPSPDIKVLNGGVTQQLTLGYTEATQQEAGNWKVSFAYGNERLIPVTQANVTDDGKGRGYMSYHFDPRTVTKFLDSAARTKQNAYILIRRADSVQRIQVRR